MKNILVPIDGSRPSHNALQHAIDIANVYNAELTIVNITNADAVLDSFDVFEDMTDEKVKDLTQLAKDKSGYVLEKAMEAAPESLTVHTVQLVSTPGQPFPVRTTPGQCQHLRPGPCKMPGPLGAQ